jgi:hypothetical protein
LPLHKSLARSKKAVLEQLKAIGVSKTNLFEGKEGMAQHMHSEASVGLLGSFGC